MLMQLLMSVIDLVKWISNLEDPELRMRNRRLSKHGAKTVEKIVNVLACREFYSFRHTSSLRAATTFMTGKHDQTEKAQRDTIHRCRFFYKINNFKLARHMIVWDVQSFSVVSTRKGSFNITLRRYKELLNGTIWDRTCWDAQHWTKSW